MISKPGVILFLLTISLSSFGQISDYIVKVNGDTLRGELKSANSFAREIRFRTTANEAFSVYTPDEVTAFSSKGLQRFMSIEHPKERQKQFCQVLIDGPVSLYKPATGFMIEKDQHLYLLEKKDTTFNGMAKEDKKYVGILSAVLTNCEGIKTKLRSQHFSAASLTSLISSYNSCVDPAGNQKVYKARKAGRIIVGIKGGSSTSEMWFDREKAHYYGIQYTTFTAVPAGVFGSIPLLRKLRAQLEIIFTKKGGSNSRVVDNGSYTEVYDTKFDFSYMQVPITLRYTLVDKRLKPVVFAGVTYSHTRSYQAYEKVHLVTGGTWTTDIRMSPKEIGVRAGAELNYLISQKIIGGLEYYYESAIGDPNASNDTFKNRTHVVSVSLGYILGSKDDN